MVESLAALFLFMLPLQFALRPAEDVDLALARVAAVGIALIWATRALFFRRLVFPRPLTFFCFTAFALWASASFLWADNVLWSLRKIGFLWSFLPLFFVFFAAVQESPWRVRLFRAFAGGAVLAALISLVQFFLQFVFGVEKVFALWIERILPFFLGPAFAESVAAYASLLVNIGGKTVLRASGFFPDPHMAAFFFGMALPIAFAFAYNSTGKMRTRWLIFSLILLCADLLTFSRGGYAGLFFGASLFVVALFREGRWGKRSLEIGASILLGVALLAVSPIGTRFFSSFSQADTSNIERLRLWQEAKDFIGRDPLRGVGMGNYSLAVKPSAEYREPRYAHNLFLDITLETGFIGLLFFTLFLGCGVLYAWRKWHKEKDIFGLALCSALVIFSVHALFETPLFSVHILPIFLFLMAASVL